MDARRPARRGAFLTPRPHPQIPGKRGFWSAPLRVRTAGVGVGFAAGGRAATTLSLLTAAEVAALAARPTRLTPCVAMTAAAPGMPAARDDSLDCVGCVQGRPASAIAEARTSRGLMIDYSAGARLAWAAGGSGGSALADPRPPRELRDLVHALNGAARLAERPAAPWPAAE